MRTSQTHPLEIAEVRINDDYGKVGLTFCPGKKQKGAATGDWDRDLDIDLDSIEEWNAAAMVTLLEEHEMHSLGVPRLGFSVKLHNLIWHYLPIRDVGIPDERFEEDWETAGAELRAILRDGFNVLVHCKGGLGRAGIGAARLLIELGMKPAQAVHAVRAVRPGAIETAAQFNYVMTLGPIPEPQPDRSRGACRDRAVGAMLGLAAGDATGTTYEFMHRDAHPPLEDMVGGGPFMLEPGQWTDDTAMALALMDSLLKNGNLNEEDLMRRFVEWYERGTYSCTGRCFDIGITTRKAIERWKASGDPFAGSTNPRSAGNGSLMRLAPVAILHWNNPEMLRDVAARQSRTTHGAPEAVDACVAYAEILAGAIAGRPRSDVMRVPTGPGSRSISQIIGGQWRGKHRDEIASSGYVVHSLEAALWSVGRNGNHFDAVLTAANLCDDADTTAAIAGQLAGALYGANEISGSWVERIAWSDRIRTSAGALFDASWPV